MAEYKFHEFSDLFPLLDGDEFAELVADIRANGLHQKIVLFEGKILDGRNRYRACLEAGIEPRFEPYCGSDAKALAFVVSANLKRRHLDESQRAMVAARIATLKDGQRADFVQGLPIGRASGMLNVSERSVARAREVLDKGTPELVAAVDSGKVKVSSAAAAARLPEAKQREVLAAGPKAVVAAAKQGARTDLVGSSDEAETRLTPEQILELKEVRESLIMLRESVSYLPVPELYVAIRQAAKIAQGYVEEEIKAVRMLVVEWPRKKEQQC